jgi:hypothetical protein
VERSLPLGGNRTGAKRRPRRRVFGATRVQYKGRGPSGERPRPYERCRRTGYVG